MFKRIRRMLFGDEHYPDVVPLIHRKAVLMCDFNHQIYVCPIFDEGGGEYIRPGNMCFGITRLLSNGKAEGFYSGKWAPHNYRTEEV